MAFGGFSWKRAVGITKTKSKISRALGVPPNQSWAGTQSGSIGAQDA